MLPHQGEPSTWCFCPTWAPPLWRARDWKGSVSVWELLELPYSAGLGGIVGQLMNALTSVENAVEPRLNPPK